MSEPWFNPAFGGYIGAAIGIFGGLIGTAIGILGGVFVPRGKGRVTVRVLLTVMMALGVVLLAFGIVALAAGQPYPVWYPPALGGVIFALVGGINHQVFRAIERQIEHRKMEADDLRHG